MNIGILGGSGFLGKNLALHLLETTDWNIRCITHSDKSFEVDKKFRGRIEFRQGDVLDEISLGAAIEDIDVLYYFVHMMGQKTGDFYELETKAANTTHSVIKRSHVKRLIYMGGLGRTDDQTLSKHLRSRHKTGEILRRLPIDVIEFRASMVIGQGSVAFDIIVNLVNTLPIMPLPNTAATRTQPILLADALSYLKQAAEVQLKESSIVEIGGPEKMSYADVYRAYADLAHKKRLVFVVPFVPAHVEAFFLDYFTPKVHARIGQAMIESLVSEMVVTDDAAKRIFPDITPKKVFTKMLISEPNNP